MQTLKYFYLLVLLFFTRERSNYHSLMRMLFWKLLHKVFYKWLIWILQEVLPKVSVGEAVSRPMYIASLQLCQTCYSASLKPLKKRDMQKNRLRFFLPYKYSGKSGNERIQLLGKYSTGNYKRNMTMSKKKKKSGNDGKQETMASHSIFQLFPDFLVLWCFKGV